MRTDERETLAGSGHETDVVAQQHAEPAGGPSIDAAPTASTPVVHVGLHTVWTARLASITWPTLGHVMVR